MLADDAAAVLAEMRPEVESMMVESCTIDRVTGEDTNAEGRVVATYLDPPPYVGKCRVTKGKAQAMSPEVGSSSPTVQGYEVHVPVGVGPFVVGDVVRMDDGRTFRVEATHEASFQSAQRLRVEGA